MGRFTEISICCDAVSLRRVYRGVGMILFVNVDRDGFNEVEGLR